MLVAYLYNDTILNSSWNVSGFTTLNNNTIIFGASNVSRFTILRTNSTLLSAYSALNVFGFYNLNHQLTLQYQVHWISEVLLFK